MVVPILKQGDILIAQVQAALTDHELLQLRDDLTDRVGRFRTKGVVIDVTAVDIMDSFATRTLRSLAETVRLRGAEAVVVGIQPDVAMSMVQLGLNLGGEATALDLDQGVEILAERIAEGRAGGR